MATENIFVQVLRSQCIVSDC